MRRRLPGRVLDVPGRDRFGRPLRRPCRVILGAVTPKLYKAAEVCERTGLQPYVLRSWEKEFPGIGIQKSPDLRVYRQSDVDQVNRIKDLVFSQGLTLSGARRRLEEASPAPAATPDAEMAEVLDTLGTDARARIAAVRTGLRSILEALSKTPGSVRIADLPETEGRVNGGRPARAKVNGRDAVGRRGGPSGPPKTAKAAKRAVPSKRGVATRKPARSTKRKRAGA